MLSACSFAKPSEMVVSITHRCIFTVASRSSDRPATFSAASVPAKVSHEASFPEPSNRLRVASSLAARRYVAAASASRAQVARLTSLRSSSVPNKRLVPTTQPLARLGSRGTAAVAAQPQRWTESTCQDVR